MSERARGHGLTRLTLAGIGYDWQCSARSEVSAVAERDATLLTKRRDAHSARRRAARINFALDCVDVLVTSRQDQAGLWLTSAQQRLPRQRHPPTRV